MMRTIRSGSGPRLGSRWVRPIVMALAVVMIVAGLGIVFNPLGWLPDGDDETTSTPRERSEIVMSDLSETIEVDGELRFAERREIAAVVAGTLTSVIGLDAQVSPSTVLYELDETPTVALIGDVPAWRTMTVDDVGSDVAQLESNLVALGYDPDGLLSVDDTFTSYTATVVERWQEDLGVEATGAVEWGSVVFVPTDTKVSDVAGAVGQSINASASGSSTGSVAGSSVLTVSTTEREVVFVVPADQAATIDVGTEVAARLPDRSSVTATVVELTPAELGTWEARAALSVGEASDTSDGTVLPSGESVPLTVSWSYEIASDATTVRANALTRHDDGSYALEVVADDGSTSFVPVGIGAASGSTIEIIGDLPPGTAIITP